MNSRNCPLCNCNNKTIIMKLDTSLISNINNTYRRDVFKSVMHGLESFLTYSKCKNCGMVYCEHCWDENTLNKVYTEVINHDLSKEKILNIDKRRRLLTEWNNILWCLNYTGRKSLNGIKLIDYGCGWGDFMDTVSGYGISCIGFEQDPIKVEFTKKRGHIIITNHSDIRDFGRVDIFVINSVLEHVQDVDFIMKLARNLLKSDGILVLEIMDYRSKYIHKNIISLKKHLSLFSKNFNPVEHVNIFEYNTVMALLKKYHFTLIATNKIFFYIFQPIIRSFSLEVLNAFERLSSKIFKSNDRSITIYALKKSGNFIAD